MIQLWALAISNNIFWSKTGSVLLQKMLLLYEPDLDLVKSWNHKYNVRYKLNFCVVACVYQMGWRSI